MAVLVKTMAELFTAVQEARVVGIWGTALIVYALVYQSGGTLEMWSVTA